jgi:hypothetical protein
MPATSNVSRNRAEYDSDPARPEREIKERYANLVARVALRTMHERLAQWCGRPKEYCG